MENQSHGVCDIMCDEARSQVCCGNIPQVMAVLRHTVIGLGCRSHIDVCMLRRSVQGSARACEGRWTGPLRWPPLSRPVCRQN